MILTIPLAGYAQTIEGWVEDSQLHNDATWLKLLHFKESESDIISDHFFLAKGGRYSAKAELIETIKQFGMPTKSDVKHAQCRFPARFLWLKDKLKSNFSLTEIACSEFMDWQKKAGTDSISVVFASGYLENPASLYGHLMLKFNDSKRSNPLLDKSINYGADTPKNENPISYVLKGIFGGYEGVFSQAEFYKNNMLYGEMELRDLWEYRLNLSPQKVALVRAHAYELLNTRFQYFFFRENCAMQIADIVGLVEPDTLYNNSLPWVLPIDVIEHLEKSSLVAKVNEFPSRQTRFYNNYNRLASDDKTKLKTFLENQDLSSLNLVADPIAKQMLMDSALDFYAYEYVLTDDKALYNSKKYPLLAYQSTQPMVKLVNDSITPKRPEQSTKPLMFAVGPSMGKTSENTGLQYRIRAAYFDGLNLNYGKPKYATLSMFDLTVFQNEDDIKLKHLDLVKVESIQPSMTGIAADKGSTWNFNVGYESNDYGQGAFIKGGKGLSYMLTPDLVAVAMLNVRGSTSGEQVSIMPQLRVVSNGNQSYAYSAQLEYSQHLENEYNRFISQFELRLFRTRDREVSVLLKNDRSLNTGIFYHTFF
ncbi:MAG: DUF4105 domain-containing protein [Thiotrichales bacterium]|nr:DUF4105 domain-containing protein [Thiotrichales bacterium]